MNVQTVDLENFAEFLQQTINKKLDCFLGKLFKLFGQFFRCSQSLIELLVELLELLASIQCVCDSAVQPRQIIHNALHFLNLFFVEYPQFLSFEYCDHFANIAEERVQQIKGNIHPIDHVQVTGSNLSSVHKLRTEIYTKTALLTELVGLIRKEIQANSHILKQKDDIYKNFYDKVDYIQDKYTSLRENTQFRKNFKLLQGINSPQSKESINDFFYVIQQCINIAQSFFQLLEVPIQYAKAAKSQSKKNLKGTLNEVASIVKYSPILSNIDQLWSAITVQNYEEIIDCIRALEKQTFIEQQTSFKFQFTTQDFRMIVNQKELIQQKIQNIFKKPELIHDWSVSPPIGLALNHFQQLLPHFLGSISSFLILCSLFKQVQKEISQFFLSKFQVQIQLDCSDLETKVYYK